MKYYLILTTILLCSCRSVKQRSNSILHHDKATYQNKTSAQQWFWQQDSTSRYWSFRTDTTFYFHPDSGLYASGGTLLLREIRQRASGGQHTYDSSMYVIHENQQIAQQTFSERVYKRQYWWIAIALVIGIVGVWLLFR
ncbi:hypothetical protein G5B30_15975 [Sphingobacterium sp. SGG-5]|uniref:hypothetical protein n=1 Tax=Sphingobacterium sp. SGG-5 TaxID=2710881 RepID=UPI0013ED885A|nr:hypothetical protein [Sphingobacterium sp. SGG-5]NGM63409.1 hypothetical protein [Sphingobacterium sp. SGG-5]